MNCREGDLAYYRGKYKEHWGRIVLVGKPTSALDDRAAVSGPYWYITPALLVDKGLCNKAADASLRPIRNPGDDAQDESLSWKKVPSTDKREELA